MTPNLNLDCLEHIFQFVSPKDWISFTKVCKAWKQAAISKEFHTLIYDEYPEKNKSYADKEKLNYKEFLEILQFVAPKIKQTKFERMDHGDKNVDVLVAFGKFDYALEVNYKERQYLTNVFVQQTECIEKLKLSSFDGATKREWARFFQTNPLKSFKFFSANYREQSTFYHDYVCFLPESLEKIEFYWPNYYDEEECFYFSFDKILQFLQTHPNLSKVSIPNALNPAIAKELSKHNEKITKLSITYSQYENSQHAQTILESINVASFTKLKKLHLRNFNLDDNLCRKIAENCQNIRSLDIIMSEVSEMGLQALMSLPNLTDLRINPIKINLNKKVTSLKKLVYIIYIKNQVPDYGNLARALTWMPNLTSLAFISWSYLQKAELTEKSLLKIQKPVHSRGQNVVLYSSDSEMKVKKRLREILCDKPSSKELSILISEREIDLE